MSQPASESENDIHVEIDVPAAEPEPAVEETPAVVVVETGGSSDDGPGDGVLAALLDISGRLERLEMTTAQVAEVAVNAEVKAEAALQADAEIQTEVAEIAADVEEALEEDQAPADQDESPRKAHWLHR